MKMKIPFKTEKKTHKLKNFAFPIHRFFYVHAVDTNIDDYKIYTIHIYTKHYKKVKWKRKINDDQSKKKTSIYIIDAVLQLNFLFRSNYLNICRVYLSYVKCRYCILQYYIWWHLAEIVHIWDYKFITQNKKGILCRLFAFEISHTCTLGL